MAGSNDDSGALKSEFSLPLRSATTSADFAHGFVSSHGVGIVVSDPSHALPQGRPVPVHSVSDPIYQSPLRHHQRAASRSTSVKTTLDAQTHYGSDDNDGAAVHRINQYIIKQEIGRGSFGAVHLAVDQYGREYAVKEFSKARLRRRAKSSLLRRPRPAARGGFNAGPYHDIAPSKSSPIWPLKKLFPDNNNALDLIKEEIAIMKKLDHPNLVQLIEVLDDPSEDSLYMVLEMCKKGVVMNLTVCDDSDDEDGASGTHQRAEPYPDHVCRTWFRDLLLGIEYLHAQGIIHRDIKPDNCLITEDDVLKLVDFGVSEMFDKASVGGKKDDKSKDDDDDDLKTNKSAGSPAFMPPELCVARHGSISGRAADIWSMGVTLYCLRYGRIPFDRKELLELYESIRHDDVVLPGELDEDFRDLMSKLLEKDPHRRITMEQLRDHPWVTANGTTPLLSAAENCAAMISDPTEHDLNYAITGNMEHLLVVMKAVRRFKDRVRAQRSDEKRRSFKPPPILATLFGGPGSRLTAPPDSIQRSKSVEGELRGAGMEKEIVISGLHRDMRGDNHDAISSPAQMSLSSPQSPGTPDTLMPSRQDTKMLDDSGRAIGMGAVEGKRSDTAEVPQHKQPQNVDEGLGRGHARDPLADKLFLNVGAGTADFSKPPDFVPGETDIEHLASLENPSDAPFVIAESPAGLDDTECNIYETAYQDEVRRILAEREREKAESPSSSNHPPVVLHLTKQVEHLAELRNHPNIVEGSEIAKGFMKEARGAAGDFADAVRQAAERAHALAMEKAGQRNDGVSAVDGAGSIRSPSEILRKRSSIFDAVKASTSGLWQQSTRRNVPATTSSTTAVDPSEPRRSSDAATASTSTSTTTTTNSPRTATDLAVAAATLSQKVLASLWQPSGIPQPHLEQQQQDPTSSDHSASTPTTDLPNATPAPNTRVSNPQQPPRVNTPRNVPTTPSRVFNTVAERVYNRAEKVGNIVVDVAGKVDDFKAQQQEQRQFEQQQQQQAGAPSSEGDAVRNSSVASSSPGPGGRERTGGSANASASVRGRGTGGVVLKKSLGLMRKRFSREGP